MHVHESKATGPEFQVRCLPGKNYGPVYNVDSERAGKAKAGQPEPGEKPMRPHPLWQGWMADIERTADGQLHVETGVRCCVLSLRDAIPLFVLPDPPITTVE